MMTMLKNRFIHNKMNEILKIKLNQKLINLFIKQILKNKQNLNMNSLIIVN